MKNSIKKTVLIALLAISGLSIIFMLSFPSFAQKVKETLGVQPSDSKKSVVLFNKIKQYADSSFMFKYSYTMDFEYDDSTKQSYSGVNYKGKNLNIDSNDAQFTFNDAKEYFAINHKTQLAVYSNLVQFRQELAKNNTKTKSPIDSLQIQFGKTNGINFSDSLMYLLIDKDRSYEDNNRIVIDVDFIEESPILSYYLVFDKSKQMTDSMIVKLTQMDDIDAPDTDENNDEDYYRDLVAQESYITFTAYDFKKGQFPVSNMLQQYVYTKGNKVTLAGYKNYHLTILK